MYLLYFVFADPVQKDEINKKAFEKFRKEHTCVAPSVDNAVPSERFDGECHITRVDLLLEVQSQLLRVTNAVFFFFNFQPPGATSMLLPGPQRSRSF